METLIFICCKCKSTCQKIEHQAETSDWPEYFIVTCNRCGYKRDKEIEKEE